MIDLRHGDCLEILPTIEDKSVDLILTDLPYEVLNKGNEHAAWDKMLPLDKLWTEFKRVIKSGGGNYSVLTGNVYL
jgi:DNA modification methylase